MKKPLRILWSVVGIAVALIWVFPVYWMLNSAMLPTVVLERSKPTWVPFGGSFQNFVAVFSKGTFQKALGISVAVALITVIVCLIFAFLAHLAISRFRFRGRKPFILAILLIQMLPAVGLLIAQYRLIKSLGETVSPVIGLNSILGLSITYAAAVVPFTIWMLRGFVAGIPADLEEAAMVDGLSRTQAFLRITFPLLTPGLVAVPVIIFFMFVQGRMTSGLVSGAVKG